MHTNQYLAMGSPVSFFPGLGRGVLHINKRPFTQNNWWNPQLDAQEMACGVSITAEKLAKVHYGDEQRWHHKFSAPPVGFARVIFQIISLLYHRIKSITGLKSVQVD